MGGKSKTRVIRLGQGGQVKHGVREGNGMKGRTRGKGRAR